MWEPEQGPVSIRANALIRPMSLSHLTLHPFLSLSILFQIMEMWAVVI